MQNYIFFVYLISINNLIPILALIPSVPFIKIPMPNISVEVIIFFQRSIFRAWKKLNSFQLFLSLARLQVFSKLSLSSFNRNAAMWRKFSFLDVQQSVSIPDDIVQAIWIKRLMLQFQVLPIYSNLLWVNYSYTYLGKFRTLLWSKIYTDV